MDDLKKLLENAGMPERDYNETMNRTAEGCSGKVDEDQELYSGTYDIEFDSNFVSILKNELKILTMPIADWNNIVRVYLKSQRNRA